MIIKYFRVEGLHNILTPKTQIWGCIFTVVDRRTVELSFSYFINNFPLGLNPTFLEMVYAFTKDVTLTKLMMM